MPPPISFTLPLMLSAFVSAKPVDETTARTIMSVTGDASCAIVMQEKWERNYNTLCAKHIITLEAHLSPHKRITPT